MDTTQRPALSGLILFFCFFALAENLQKQNTAYEQWTFLLQRKGEGTVQGGRVAWDELYLSCLSIASMAVTMILS